MKASITPKKLPKKKKKPKSNVMIPPKEAIEEALEFPNAFVYAIDPEYSKDGYVPPTAINGAWKTNEKGIIIGEFIPNPNYHSLTVI